jgi:bifunctional DNA-binding transcriptional regulator/antitoxin component of YhaV-PrlF toxin-antitoxin module
MLVEALIATPPAVPALQHYEVAQRIEALGLKRGDPVAIVTGDFDYFWARLAGARVTMQVDFGNAACPDCRTLQTEWEKAKPILASNGVVMVVSPCIPGVVDQPGWQQLGATGVYAYRVP